MVADRAMSGAGYPLVNMTDGLVFKDLRNKSTRTDWDPKTRRPIHFGSSTAKTKVDGPQDVPWKFETREKVYESRKKGVWGKGPTPWQWKKSSRTHQPFYGDGLRDPVFWQWDGPTAVSWQNLVTLRGCTVGTGRSHSLFRRGRCHNVFKRSNRTARDTEYNTSAWRVHDIEQQDWTEWNEPTLGAQRVLLLHDIRAFFCHLYHFLTNAHIYAHK